MHVAVPGENSMGLPVGSAESMRCVGGVRGTEDNVAVVSRASTKGRAEEPRRCNLGLLRLSTTVAEMCVNGVWEASCRSLVVVIKAACG
jgi:hypothetical protein